MGDLRIVWTDYMKFRMQLRSFDIAVVERIVRYSTERYRDMATGRRIAVGRDQDRLLMIPYDQDDDKLTPVTVHATCRQQISFRVKSGRLTNE